MRGRPTTTSAFFRMRVLRGRDRNAAPARLSTRFRAIPHRRARKDGIARSVSPQDVTLERGAARSALKRSDARLCLTSRGHADNAQSVNVLSLLLLGLALGLLLSSPPAALARA